MHNVLLYLIECVQKLISLADQPNGQPMVLVLNQLAVSHNHIFVFWRAPRQRIICSDKFY